MKGKLSTVEWIILGLFGLFFDVVQIILMFFFGAGLAANTFIAGFFFVAFGLYLLLRGYPLFETKRLIRSLGTFLVEMVPGLNNAPTCGLIVLLLFGVEKGQDVIAKKAPVVGRVLSEIQKRGPQFSGGRGVPEPQTKRDDRISGEI